jgi:hypothetical protein
MNSLTVSVVLDVHSLATIYTAVFFFFFIIIIFLLYIALRDLSNVVCLCLHGGKHERCIGSTKSKRVFEYVLDVHTCVHSHLWQLDMI